jgi:hypothetical protein
MNIFYLSHMVARCAQWHCDKHVVKMILETAQLLYTAHWVLLEDPDFQEAPYVRAADIPIVMGSEAETILPMHSSGPQSLMAGSFETNFRTRRLSQHTNPCPT